MPSVHVSIGTGNGDGKIIVCTIGHKKRSAIQTHTSDSTLSRLSTSYLPEPRTTKCVKAFADRAKGLEAVQDRPIIMLDGIEVFLSFQSSDIVILHDIITSLFEALEPVYLDVSGFLLGNLLDQNYHAINHLSRKSRESRAL